VFDDFTALTNEWGDWQHAKQYPRPNTDPWGFFRAWGTDTTDTGTDRKNQHGGVSPIAMADISIFRPSFFLPDYINRV